jgi:UDP-3-O-[3-hydroxymyristoyl] glucosamine N-acyltransferase
VAACATLAAEHSVEMAMTAWDGGLANTLAAAKSAFGIGEPAAGAWVALDQARQTGFVWTRQHGVVCLAADKRYLAMALDNPSVVAVIVPTALADVDPQGRALVVAERPDELYHHLHATQRFVETAAEPEVDPSATVDASAVLRGEVRIGAGSSIGPRVVLDGPVRIGANVRIEAGAILGCEGLYAKKIAGERRHIPHFGGVDVADGAYIHAGAVIVRSAVRGEATRIGRDAHIGVMCNIGHDVEVGDEATVSSNVVVSGRARIGARAWIGASATISNMVRIGDAAEVRIGATVIQDVPDGGDVSGNFARRHAVNMKRYLKELRDEA